MISIVYSTMRFGLITASLFLSLSQEFSLYKAARLNFFNLNLPKDSSSEVCKSCMTRLSGIQITHL